MGSILGWPGRLEGGVGAGVGRIAMLHARQQAAIGGDKLIRFSFKLGRRL